MSQKHDFFSGHKKPMFERQSQKRLRMLIPILGFEVDAS